LVQVAWLVLSNADGSVGERKSACISPSMLLGVKLVHGHLARDQIAYPNLDRNLVRKSRSIRRLVTPPLRISDPWQCTPAHNSLRVEILDCCRVVTVRYWRDGRAELVQAVRRRCRRTGRAMTVADVIITAAIFCCAVLCGWWLLLERRNK
jgi:hypothetical protein